MGVIAEEVVRIKADTGSMKSDVESAGGGISKLGMVAGAAALGGVALLGKGLMDGIKTAREHQDAMAQTMAVIKSTGGAAGVTGTHITDLSDHIEKMSGIDDLAVQAGENMLLHFGNIKNGVGQANQVFDRTTLAIADMSAATGKDFPAASKLLGTALNDPEKGLAKLAKAGVTFTDAQKASIKTMMEHGKVAGAQKIILGELETKFGGAAKAAGGTFSGQVNILKAHLEDLEQAIGEKVLPVMQTLIAWGIAHWPQFAAVAGAAVRVLVRVWTEGLLPALKIGITVVKGVIAVVSRVVGFLKENKDIALALGAAIAVLAAAFAVWQAYMLVARAATAAYTAVQWLLNAAMTANPIGIVVIAIAALVAGLVLLYMRSQTVRDIVDEVFSTMKSVIASTVAVVVPLVERIGEVIGAVIGVVVSLIRDNWEAIWGVASSIVGAFVSTVSGVINGVIEVVRGVVNLVMDLIHGNWGQLWGDAVQIVTGFIDVITGILGGFPALLLGWITQGIAALAGLAPAAAGAALGLAMGILNAITGALAGLAGLVLGYITAAVGAVTGGVGAAASAAVSFGAGILSGITGALASLASSVGGFMTAAVGAVTSAAASALNAATNFGKGIVSGAVGGATGIAASLLGIITTIVPMIATFATGILDNAAHIGQRIVAGVVQGLGGIASAALGVINDILSTISTFASGVFDNAAHIGERVKSGVVSGLAGIGAAALGVINNVIDEVNQVAQDAWSAAVRIGTRIIDGAKSGLGGLADVLKDAIQYAVHYAVTHILPFSPVEHGGDIYIGRPIAAGAISGFTKGIKGLRPAIERGLGGEVGGLGALGGLGLGGARGGATVAALDDAGLIRQLAALVDELRMQRGSGAPVTVVATGGVSAAVYSARR